jgi:poly(3-hydroxybutyrate) depolymerase
MFSPIPSFLGDLNWSRRFSGLILLQAACLIGLSASGQAATTSDFSFEASPSYEAGTMPYRLYKAQGYDLPANATRKYPLIIWLHGNGERGTNNTSQLSNGVVELANNTNQGIDSAFIMAPQCPSSQSDWFEGENRSDTIIAERRFILAVQDMKTRFRIDPDRVYVMGLSMGAKGAWDAATTYPDIFAASVPISLGASGTFQQLALLTNLPVWVFTGINDGFKSGLTDPAVANLRAAGGPVPYTVYASPAGHDANVWRSVAVDTDMYSWLMSQRRYLASTFNPLLKIQTPSADQSYLTGSSTVTLGGVFNLPTATMNPMTGMSYSVNGGGATAFTPAATWSTGSINLSAGVNFLQIFGTAPEKATAYLANGGTITFNDALMVNDTTPPVLNILNPTPAAQYTAPSDFLTFRGSASDNKVVTQITWSNSAGGSGLVGAEVDNQIGGQVNWILRKMPLRPGHNVITFTARDLAGNEATKTIDVFRSPSKGGDFFRQDFNSSSSLSAYVDSSANPAPHTVNDISAQASAGTWSINGGALQILRPGGASNTLAGLLRQRPLDGPPNGVMKISFDLSFTEAVDAYTGFAAFTLGSFISATSGIGGTGYSAINTELVIGGAGSNRYNFRINNTGSTASYLANGTLQHVTWFVNSSGASRSYQAPDGSTPSLAHNCSDVWVDSTRVITGVLKSGSYGSGELSHFFFTMSGTEASTLKIDNLVLSDFTVASPYGSWLSSSFAPSELASAAFSGEAADPDGDGIANLLEYALGGNPKTANPAIAPVIASVANYLQLTFSRIAPTDLTYVVESSTNLAAWVPIATLSAGGTSWTGTATVVESGSGATRNVTVTDPALQSAQTKSFLRLRVVYP